MTYHFGVFEFDEESGQLLRQARPVPLERQPARVLAALLARAGQVVPRTDLCDSVWGPDTHVDFDRGLAYCLSQVRAALGDRGDNPRFIQTLPRRGYKFIAPVTSSSPHPDAAHDSGAPAAPPAVPRSIAGSSPPRSRIYAIGAALVLALLVAATSLSINFNRTPTLLAVSVFDNETGVAEYDRLIASLSDLVVASLANLAPGRLAVIGNASVLRQPRNIRNLQAVKAGVGADYVLLGQLQQDADGLRFITHVIRLRDLAHLKANRLRFATDGIGTVEGAVVSEFERAVREHLLEGERN